MDIDKFKITIRRVGPNSKNSHYFIGIKDQSGEGQSISIMTTCFDLNENQVAESITEQKNPNEPVLEIRQIVTVQNLVLLSTGNPKIY